MKKLFALVAIVVLMLSIIPLAFAAQGNRNSGENSNTTSDVETGEVRTPLATQNAGEQTQLTESVRRLEVSGDEMTRETKVGDDSRKVVSTNNFREIEPLKVADRATIQKRIMEAKVAYDEAKTTFTQSRETIAEARKKFKACEVDDSTDCREAQKKVKENAKPFLGNSLEMILKALERLKEHVTSNENMDDDEQEALLAKIDEKIELVTGLQEEIEALGDDATPEQIRAAAKEARQAWRETQPVVREAAGKVVNAKLGNIIQQVEKLREKIAAIRGRLAEQGRDVTALDVKIAEFDAKLALANAEYEAAVAAFETKTGNEAVTTAHMHVKAAKDHLKEVRQQIREIVKEIRGDREGQGRGNWTFGNESGNGSHSQARNRVKERVNENELADATA